MSRQPVDAQTRLHAGPASDKPMFSFSHPSAFLAPPPPHTHTVLCILDWRNKHLKLCIEIHCNMDLCLFILLLQCSRNIIETWRRCSCKKWRRKISVSSQKLVYILNICIRNFFQHNKKKYVQSEFSILFSFVWIDALQPSQHFFSQLRHFPGLNRYLAVKVVKLKWLI